jgi:hypothetical protein
LTLILAHAFSASSLATFFGHWSQKIPKLEWPLGFEFFFGTSLNPQLPIPRVVVGHSNAGFIKQELPVNPEPIV